MPAPLAKLAPGPPLSRWERLKLNAMAPVGRVLETIVKGIFAGLNRSRLRKVSSNTDPAPVPWLVLNAQLGRRLVVPFLMVSAPRWNTHALVCSAGPFRTEGDSIRFDPEGLNESASVWCLVVYRSADSGTVAAVSSADAHDGAIVVPLEPGVYGIGLRLYRPSGRISLPVIEAGGKRVVAAGPDLELANVPRLEEQIFRRSSPLYALIHSPVRALLTQQTDEANQQLTKRYLPVGSPETLYVFGPVERGARLTVDASAVAAGSCLIFATVYNTSSFPELSIEIAAGTRAELPPAARAGSVLVRIVPVRGLAEANRHLLDQVRLVPAGSPSHVAV